VNPLRVDALATEIENRILDGVIPLGSWLRQDALAREFRVSRMPVRAALQKLEGSGLVQLYPYRGAFVGAPTPRQLRQDYQIRAELEGLAAELAASRIRPEQIDELRRESRRFADLVDRVTAARRGDEIKAEDANARFHRVIHEVSGNERLAEFLLYLYRRFPRPSAWAAQRENPRALEANASEHEALIEALERGDSSAARRLMTEHIARGGAVIADWLERHPDLSDPQAR
jgi:DNA-binding GntR family transcriptional regulator